MATTVLDLITEALVAVKALAAGETPGADMTTDGLTRFNEVLESLSLQDLAIFANTFTAVPLQANKRDYSIGPSGDVIAQRPLAAEAISAAYVTYNGADMPVEVVALERWAGIVVKGTPGIPTWAAFDSGWPNTTLHLWPVPYQAATLTLIQQLPFTAAPTLTSVVDMPPGYRRMLRLMLAWELLSDYPGMTADQVAKLKADKTDAIALVKGNNGGGEDLMRSEVADLMGGSYVNWRDGA